MRDEVKEIISHIGKQTYVIEDEMKSMKKYKHFISTIYSYIIEGFEEKELRECIVHYKFNNDGEEYGMQLRHFLTNIIFWAPLIKFKAVNDLDESFIIDTSKISSKLIKSYIDDRLILPYRSRVSNKKMNKVIHNLLFYLAKISNDFNIILGLSIDYETFIDVANKNERFDEIIRTKVDPNSQPSEIEAELDRLLKEQVEILKNEDSALKPMLMAGSGIKEKQLSEFSINGGLKPSLEGKTLPVPINSNLLVGGLNSVSNYYIDSIGKF